MGLEATGDRTITPYVHGICSSSTISSGNLDFLGKSVSKSPLDSIVTGRRHDITVETRGSVVNLLNPPT